MRVRPAPVHEPIERGAKRKRDSLKFVRLAYESLLLGNVHDEALWQPVAQPAASDAALRFRWIAAAAEICAGFPCGRNVL